MAAPSPLQPLRSWMGKEGGGSGQVLRGFLEGAGSGKGEGKC